MIMKRIPGYSDKQMLEQCQRHYDIIFKTVKKKIPQGIGKKAVYEDRKAFYLPKHIEDNAIESLEYYKQRAMTPRKIKFREYQKDIIRKGSETLLRHRFLYLAMEVRTGKTLTSLGIASLMNAKRVLFLTKKKAIISVEEDYKLLNPDFDFVVINYESMHKVEGDFDFVVLDEAHSMGAFPKPSNRAKAVKELLKKVDNVILLSGTPTPESYSQMYHQVYGINKNPFKEFANFYKFAAKYVKVKSMMLNGFKVNDYKDGSKEILDLMKPYTISFSQQEAGFKGKITENFIEVEMTSPIYRLCKALKSDKVVEGKEEVILADTPVKLMSKLHQLYSGTIKFESGNSKVLDLSKAESIKKKFDGKKIGIFYKFKEELNALKEVFGKDNLTTDIKEFKDTEKSIALQIVSGREGVSLKEASDLVYYNIDFSATSYWQSRDRMTTKDRSHSDVWWVFSKNGIERQIYNAVSKKKDYTVNHFKKDLLSL